MLLPTHLYLLGGVLAVALSFLVVALVPPRRLARLEALRWRWPAPPRPGAGAVSAAASLASLAAAVVLIAAGLGGSRDPLANPLPLFVWTVWWIGLTYLHAVAGDLWAHLNPWSGLHRLLTAAGPLARWRRAGPLRYPERAACWPAVAGLLAFGWFELVHPAPTDPAVLARVVAGYLAVHLVGALAFGEAWLRRAETFAVFFRIVSWVAPAGRAGGRVEVTLPALRLLALPPPDASVAAFVLLALAVVSFDGLARTFTWVAFLGANPLVHPGRSALVGPNTLGLLGLGLALGLAYLGAVRLGARLGPAGGAPGPAPAVLVPAVVPIVCGYHFAHYLPVFLVDVQHALRAASDPFARGWDLLGTADLHVVASLLTDPARAYPIWHAQVALIVGAHVAGVVLAHVLAARHGGRAAAALGQLPLVGLMIGYTLLGLWLLSTPAVG